VRKGTTYFVHSSESSVAAKRVLTSTFLREGRAACWFLEGVEIDGGGGNLEVFHEEKEKIPT